MSKSFLFFVFGLSFLSLIAQQPPKRIRFEHLTVADGLPENTVRSMLQDHLGYIWMGTQFGLVRYDGNKVVSFPYNRDNPYGFRGMQVGALFEDQHGDIWIGTENLVRFERSTQRFIQYPDKNSSDFGFEFIRFMHQDKKGFIWTVRDIKDQLKLNRFDPKTSTWAYFSNDPGNPHYLADNSLVDLKFGLTEDKDGKVWIVTNGQNENNLQSFDPNTDKFIPVHPRISPAMAEDFKKIHRITTSGQGILYLTADLKGFFVLNIGTGEVKQFRHQDKVPESLLSDSIYTVYPDKKGLAWISTSKGLDRYDPQTDSFTNYISRQPDLSTPVAGWVTGFYETPGGDIWFGNLEPAGMSFYQRSSNSFTRYKSDVKQDDALWGQIGSTLVDHTGIIWLGSFNNGVNKESRTSQFPLIKNIPGNTNSLQDDKIYSTYEAKSEPGIIWFGTGKGLDRYDNKTGRYTHYQHDDHNKNSISKGSALCLAEDKNGRFWVGTDGGGLNLMDRKKDSFIHFVFDSSNTNSLGSFYNQIVSLKSAADGTLWVGTNEGLDHFDFGIKKFTHYQKADTSYTPELFELINRYTKADGRVAAIVHPTDDVNSTVHFDLKEPSDLLVTGMGEIHKSNRADYGWIEDARGRIIWSMDFANTLGDVNGRIRSGILHLDKGSYFLRYTSDGGYSFGRWVLGAPLHSDLWGITITRIPIEEAEAFNREVTKRDFNGLGDNKIICVTEDSKKNLWIGSNNGGIDFFDPTTGKFASYENRSTGPTCVISIMEDKKTGNVWVGDYLFGLLLMNPKGEVIKTYNASNGLPSNSVIGIEMDQRGILWIATENGLCRFDPATEKFQLYNKKNGLQGLTFNNAASQTADGEMYFGGDHGINAFYPAQILLDTIAPLVVFTDLDINGKPATIGQQKQMPLHISVAKDIELPHNLNELTFHFTSLLFDRGNESQFAYKLSPGDKDWVKSGEIRQAHYTNLSPGQYTFVVKAANADGVWNETGVSINILILSPWWKTWWAYTLFGILVIGAIWGLMYYRSQQLQKENLLLEKKVTVRTNQLNQSLEELKSTQAQLIQSEKMASLGELTAGIAHEIQNPLNFVNKFSEVNTELIEELEQEVAKGNLDEVKVIARNIKENEEKINHHGKRADSIVKGMLEHSRTSTGIKEPTDINKLADEYLRLSYHGIRAKDKEFNAVMKTDFDESIGNINIVPQDIGRVLLNLFNNAFYVVTEKKKQQPEGYEPTVSVSTKKINDKVEIRVKDNGKGIPQKVVDKIFQPFFTLNQRGKEPDWD